MKKNLLLFFLLTFIGYACDSSEDTAEASFTIEISGESNPTTFDMGPDKHSETISIKSNASWKIDKPQTAGWLSITPVSGENDGSVTLSTEANETTETRESIVDFYMNDKKIHSMTVRQAPQDLPIKEKTLLLDIIFNNDGTATDGISDETHCADI